MPSPPDRPTPLIKEMSGPLPWPAPPTEVFAVPALNKEQIDIRWTNPVNLYSNSCLNIIGVNIYRSYDSEAGPYFRINSVPVGSNFWRDNTQIAIAVNEDVSRSFTLRGAQDDVRIRWMFRTQYKPLVIQASSGAASDPNLYIRVTVNNTPACVESIFADQGIVELRHIPSFDPTNQIQIPAVLPVNDTDIVLATYKYYQQHVPTNLNRRIYYRISTVAYDSISNTLVETPLNRAAQTNRNEVEKLDYIWSEAVRRNRWILQQGGERVQVFIRKSFGMLCGCVPGTHEHALSDCLVCFGTGFIGGYDGPYDIILAPDDSESSITRSNRGSFRGHAYDSWTGPNPLLSQRDFIVKKNGDRYGIGAVRMPSNRGMQLQQFFSISYLDEHDIRYRVQLPDINFIRFIDPGFQTTDPSKIKIFDYTFDDTFD
jgi:hypothetical protein